MQKFLYAKRRKKERERRRKRARKRTRGEERKKEKRKASSINKRNATNSEQSHEEEKMKNCSACYRSIQS